MRNPLGTGHHRRRVLALATALALTVAIATPAFADVSDAPARTWGTNGRVLSILSVGGLVYVGGTFTAVVDPAGHTSPASDLAVFDPDTGTFDPGWGASADGAVNAMAASGGRLYIGGLFAHVDGATQRKLAALDIATGSLVGSWDPTVDNQVDQVSVGGGFVYASGNFDSVTDGHGTHAQSFIARFDAGTGDFDPSWTPAPDGRVRTVLAAPNGTRVFVGGDFTEVSGAGGTTAVASLLTSTGAVDPSFAPGPNNQNQRASVYDLTTDGTTLVEAVGGTGGACTAVNASSGAAIWSHHANGNLQSVRLIGPVAYCGGHFNGSGSFDGFDRNKLADVDLAGGAVLDVDPKVNSALGIWSLGADATHLYAGGDFTKISGVNQAHFAAFSDEGTQTKPLAPQSLAAEGGDATVFLSWAAPSSDGGSKIKTYAVYRAVGSGTLKKVGSSKSLAFTDTNVTNGTAYTYAVSAVNAIGEGPRSGTAGATPVQGSVTPPGAPGSLDAVGAPSLVPLTWTTPTSDGHSPITGYQILRSTSTGTETLLTTTGVTTAYDDAAVVVGVRYFYLVEAVNAAGAGPPSNEASAAPNSGVPVAPVLAGTSSGGTVTLTWNNPSDNGSPIIRFTLIRDGIRIATLTATTFSYVDPAVVHGTTYQYKIKAINGVGPSKYSNTVMITAN